MVWLWLPVVSVTLVPLAVKDEIAGFWLSILATTIFKVSVSSFPAASVAVAVKLNVLLPQLLKSL